MTFRSKRNRCARPVPTRPRLTLSDITPTVPHELWITPPPHCLDQRPHESLAKSSAPWPELTDLHPAQSAANWTPPSRAALEDPNGTRCGAYGTTHTPWTDDGRLTPPTGGQGHRPCGRTCRRRSGSPRTGSHGALEHHSGTTWSRAPYMRHASAASGAAIRRYRRAEGAGSVSAHPHQPAKGATTGLRPFGVAPLTAVGPI